jgi:hypothetical protein
MKFKKEILVLLGFLLLALVGMAIPKNVIREGYSISAGETPYARAVARMADHSSAAGCAAPNRDGYGPWTERQTEDCLKKGWPPNAWMHDQAVNNGLAEKCPTFLERAKATQLFTQ